ncbi:tripartite tricarboxylate transporter substrate binding protein [Bordetella petrii]|nr:tripartite tricarboxylate transporter substrate binding protein [Bordetella petrii]
MIARLIAVLGVLLGVSALANAGPYPDRPVKIVVPYTAGGSVDMVGREIAKKLEDTFRQTFVIENKSGASANIGAAYVANSDPDGYTLLMSAATTLAAAPSLFKNLTYDPRKDLTPVALIAAQPNVLVTNSSVSVTSVAELIELARAKPDKLNYAIVSIGGPQHMAGELFMQMTGTKLIQVPYRGGANAVTDLLGGQVNLMFAAVPEVLPFIQAGKLRPLAVTTTKRTSLLPDVPSLDELGLHNYELVGWIGLAAPAGTPDEIVQALNAAIGKALGNPEFKQRFHAMGLEPLGGSVQDFKSFVDAEVEKYRQLAQSAGIKPQ